MTRISFQLYSARKFDLTIILPQLAETGLREVEGYGGLYADADEFHKKLEANGLRMSTGHFDLAMLRDDPDEVIRIATLMGMESVIIPFLKPEDRPADFAGWQALRPHWWKLASQSLTQVLALVGTITRLNLLPAITEGIRSRQSWRYRTISV